MNTLPQCQAFRVDYMPCNQPATFRDDGVPTGASGHYSGHHCWTYKTEYLCYIHALERQKQNTARVSQFASEI